MIKYALHINGNEIKLEENLLTQSFKYSLSEGDKSALALAFFLTKLDVLSGFKEIPVCVAYEIDGKRVEELPASQSDFHHAKPIYEYLPGWKENISKARSVADLPKNAQEYVKFLEKISGAPMSAIGVGPGRDETIVVRDLIK